MNILILQHAGVEHPGIFRSFLDEDGLRSTTVNLDQGEAIPDIAGFDALWVLGGPMDVWQEDIHPWLIEEKAFIRNAVEGHGVPYLGLCLGHQLLAEALGGTVALSETPEIGVCQVQLTEAATDGIFFDDIPEQFSTLQWHSAEVKTMPAGAICLATSPECSVQAMSWGPRAFSMQFHVEVEADTVVNWAGIPEYAEALEGAMGQGAVARLASDCAAHMSAFNRNAERIYMNWLQTTART